MPDRRALAPYALCEAATASSTSPLHIRPLTHTGRHTGGGVDTPALCGRQVSWDCGAEDVAVEVAAAKASPRTGGPGHLCHLCAGIFEDRTASSPDLA